MAVLSTINKLKLEKLFNMGSGYVLDFSNRTFQEFIEDNLNINVYDSKYEKSGDSKANRLRSLWEMESNTTVGKLLEALVDYWKTKKLLSGENISITEEQIAKECLQIATNLKKDTVVENIDAIKANSEDKDFQKLAKLIRESIERNEPETALDRLHTFTVRFMRELCNTHKIAYGSDTPLNSLCGSYVKFLISSNILESDMSAKILKYSISVFEAFNDVRNNKSLAHANNILNYNESVLIFNNVSNIIKFINTVEDKFKHDNKIIEKTMWENIEFTEEEIAAAGDRYIQEQIDINRGK